MTPTPHIISVALATLAFAAPAAVARPIDERGQIGTSSLAGTTTPRQDLRNADNRAIENALAQEREYGSYDSTAQELRSPDTRDAAAGRGTFNAPDVTVVSLPKPAPVSADGGFDWSDAGIGAGSLLGIIAIGLGGATAIVHRRRRGTGTATIA